MNRFFTNLAEQSLAQIFHLTRGRWTPNPYQPLTPEDSIWITACPEDFYAIPESPPELGFCRDCLSSGTLHDRFMFPSSYTSPFPENNIVQGLAHLRREGQARAALIIVHGHAMTTVRLLEWYARPAMQMDMDVYFIELPYHMHRAPRGSWSGQFSLNADIRGSAMAFRQGVKDLRALMSWIESERHAPVILAGVSLGAYTCCMAAVVDDRPRAVISMLGGGSLAQIIWDGYQCGRSKRQLQAAGISLDQLEQAWALLGPANWRSKVSADRILMIGGQYDPIVTPPNVDRLWRAWDQPALHCYPAGHATIATYHHAVRDEIFRFVSGRI